ncbi:uncharacterized protein LOC118738126 [Rhagoletis pomonella]|uniref:uncharacterized protein LOC118738126 n=1 Tax=Rhagoletis pomonella TaxID=28610 RepID=UPI00178460FA|nr:uncharacterized protein LOC118738126 [Rhagoletis pomonella]
MPFLPEETLKTQRVEIYLNDLKERLKDLRVQHDEVIQNSVDIIKEIDEVSSGLLLPQKIGKCSSDNVTKIKRLIQEFETARESNSKKMPISIESKVDIRKILQNFEQLNESQVLKESLVLFKRAKESLEKIDTFLGTNLDNVIIQSVNTNKPNAGHAIISVNATVVELNGVKESISFNLSRDTKQTFANCGSKNVTDDSLKLANDPVLFTNPAELAATGSQISSNSNSSLRDRIDMFNNKEAPLAIDYNKLKDITPSCYASCCSSLTSVDAYQSTENLCEYKMINNESNGVNSLEIGYEGDNDDSEYDLFATKRKKDKISSANQ